MAIIKCSCGRSIYVDEDNFPPFIICRSCGAKIKFSDSDSEQERVIPVDNRNQEW